MSTISSNQSKKYVPLSADQVHENLSLLKELFGKDTFTEQTETFFKAWMKALGQEFYIRKEDFTPAYKALSLSMAQQLTPIEGSHSAQAGQPIYFNSGSNKIAVTNNKITFEGSDAKTDDLFKMAFLASRDEDLMKEGIKLDGNLYERAMLQFSLEHINKERGGNDVKIQNKLTKKELKNPAVQKAFSDLASYKKLVPSTKKTEQNKAGPALSVAAEKKPEPKQKTDPASENNPDEVKVEKKPENSRPDYESLSKTPAYKRYNREEPIRTEDYDFLDIKEFLKRAKNTEDLTTATINELNFSFTFSPTNTPSDLQNLVTLKGIETNLYSEFFPKEGQSTKQTQLLLGQEENKQVSYSSWSFELSIPEQAMLNDAKRINKKASPIKLNDETNKLDYIDVRDFLKQHQTKKTTEPEAETEQLLLTWLPPEEEVPTQSKRRSTSPLPYQVTSKKHLPLENINKRAIVAMGTTILATFTIIASVKGITSNDDTIANIIGNNANSAFETQLENQLATIPPPSSFEVSAASSTLSLNLNELFNIKPLAQETNYVANLTGFDEIANFVIDNLEGGGDRLIPEPNGSFSKYGINSEANPDIDVANLTREGALDIYKERYWNKINADSLPAHMRLDAFDTAVLPGPGLAVAFYNESNGELEQFRELRASYFENLAEEYPEKFAKYLEGWGNRMEKVGVQTALLLSSNTPLSQQPGAIQLN